MRRLASSRLSGIAISESEATDLYRDYPSLPKSHLTGCPTCGKNRGPGVDGTIRWKGEEWECDCLDQLQRAKHYYVAGIGDMLQRIHYDDWTRDRSLLDSIDAYRSNAEHFIRSGIGIVAYGPPGTGKTILLVLLLKDLIRDVGIRAYYTTFGQMVSMFTAGWHDSSARERYKRKVMLSQVLMIDDISAEYSEYQFARIEIDNLLRFRVQQGMPTFVTTNMSTPEFERLYTVRTMDLLVERCVEMRFEGSSYRQEMSKKVISEALAGERRPIF